MIRVNHGKPTCSLFLDLCSVLFVFFVVQVISHCIYLPFSENFTVVSVHDSFYIVSANNTGNDSTIYFQISKNGQVLEVSHKNEF